MKKMTVVPTVPYSHSQMMRDILGLKTAYPGLILSKNVGFSVEGRPLPMLIFGKGNTKVFLCGTHHAREYITSAYLMYMINAYAEAYAANKRFGSYDIRQLLSECSIYIMPMVNPDGVALVQGGIKAAQDPDEVAAIRMIRPSYAEWKANIKGVDLNRQYPALWDLKNVMVTRPASEMYNGEVPCNAAGGPCGDACL